MKLLELVLVGWITHFNLLKILFFTNLSPQGEEMILSCVNNITCKSIRCMHYYIMYYIHAPRELYLVH